LSAAIYEGRLPTGIARTAAPAPKIDAEIGPPKAETGRRVVFMVARV